MQRLLDFTVGHPYPAPCGVRLLMAVVRIASLSVALLGLLISPMAWGCDGIDMQSCAASGCPMMSAGHQTTKCHEGVPEVEVSQRSCHATPEARVACCETQVDTERLMIGSIASSSFGPTPQSLLSGQVAIGPVPRPPDLAWMALGTRRHELGRFTLLSTFLL